MGKPIDLPGRSTSEDNLKGVGLRVLYLSGAARVSTNEATSTPGPRSHINGVLQGFHSQNWQTSTFIVGNAVPASLTGMAQKEQAAEASLKTDLARLGITAASRLALRMTRRTRRPNLIYERFGTLATLGDVVRRRDIPWILESNGLFYEEAAKDRGSLRMVERARAHELAAYRECDLLVTVSNGIAEAIRAA